MSTPQEQVRCVLWLAVLQSLTAVQGRFKMQYGRQHPTRKSIRFWNNKLRPTASLLPVKSPGKPRTSEESVNRIIETFERSPRKSIRASSLKLRTNSTLNSARCYTKGSS
jgi:hypothetical protein